MSSCDHPDTPLGPHQLAALFLVALQQRWAEAALQGCLHAIDEAPALQDLLLQGAEVIHMADGVAAITVCKRTIGGLPFQLRVRVQSVCFRKKNEDVNKRRMPEQQIVFTVSPESTGRLKMHSCSAVEVTPLAVLWLSSRSE